MRKYDLCAHNNYSQYYLFGYFLVNKSIISRAAEYHYV